MKDIMKGVIIDLRSNPGGLLDQAISVAGTFLPPSTPILSIKGRNNDFTREFKTDKSDITNGLPIIVLINKGSASASEIVAGALQDHKRAIIIGQKSFGKGSVQVTLPIKNGGGIKITTAFYYTPNNREIQGKGIIPDIVVEDAVVIKKIKASNSFSEENLKNSIKHDVFLKEQDAQNNENNAKEIWFFNREIVGDELADFQLIRGIDLINTFHYMDHHMGE